MQLKFPMREDNMYSYDLNDTNTQNLNNPTFSTDNIGLFVAQKLLTVTDHTASPYKLHTKFEHRDVWDIGTDTTVDPLAIISPHFEVVLREAFSTGALGDMNKEEKMFFMDYVRWVDCGASPHDTSNDPAEGDEGYVEPKGCDTFNFNLRTPVSALMALDYWLVKEVECTVQRQEDSEMLHTWNKCENGCNARKHLLTSSGRHREQHGPFHAHSDVRYPFI